MIDLQLINVNRMKEWYLFTEVFYLLITQVIILLRFTSGNCEDIVELDIKSAI